ncbi:DUF885 domain-containing protein [Nakamurella aerolata]|uniref:DUF885 domain-containing protein n=1 Tax=Nakamurella aerolata TaxID=1656892 RepID=A0A849A5Y2_9ACTN|nr:DUF885 domain-containing protein [Nakamurella aerolata]NNG34803.1 DUF885 domain-containing protein [Nakamurella aerolata]
MDRTPAAATAAPVTPAAQRLSELIDSEWSMRRRLEGSGFLDEDGPSDQRFQLPDTSAAARAGAQQQWADILAELDTLDLATLGPRERVDLEVFRFQVEIQLANAKHRSYQWAANSDTGFWTNLTGGVPDRFSAPDQVPAYLEMLRGVAGYVDARVDDLRSGLARGFAPSRASMAGRDATARAVAQASDPADTPFAVPLLAAQQAGWMDRSTVDEGLRIVAEQIIPAFGRLSEYLASEYLPQLGESPAASDLPKGKQFYADQLREYTTTDLTGEQIHQIGLDEVAAIEAEMTAIAAELGYTGDDAVAQLLEFMRTDPQFFATTAEQLLHLAAWECKKFDAVAQHWFGRLPRRRFGIEEPPPELAPTYTAGRGGPGRYVVNTYDLGARPLHSIPALTLHEAAPGHAFQIPFAQELELPDFRRLSYLSAYGEGWALYCERLGDEMGIYETPYQRMGMLSFQMWRAVRLVIDPGIHLLGWTREQAIEYLRGHTAMSLHDVTTEVDRYITWPGQAASYYLGMLEIRRLRAEAEQALGERFDIRAFHDCVLATGSVPLTVLQEQVRQFIAGGGRSPFADRQP